MEVYSGTVEVASGAYATVRPAAGVLWLLCFVAVANGSPRISGYIAGGTNTDVFMVSPSGLSVGGLKIYLSNTHYIRVSHNDGDTRNMVYAGYILPASVFAVPDAHVSCPAGSNATLRPASGKVWLMTHGAVNDADVNALLKESGGQTVTIGRPVASTGAKQFEAILDYTNWWLYLNSTSGYNQITWLSALEFTAADYPGFVVEKVTIAAESYATVRPAVGESWEHFWTLEPDGTGAALYDGSLSFALPTTPILARCPIHNGRYVRIYNVAGVEKFTFSMYIKLE